VLLLAHVGSGCIYTRNVTDTPRSATEQLLVSTAIERALDRLELPDVAGKNVSVDVVSLAREDEATFLKSVAIVYLRRAQATIVEPDEADLRLLLRADTLGTVSRQFVFGIPPVPIPDAAFTVPGLPFVSSLKQRGYAKLRLVTTDQSGNLLAESAPSMQRATFDVFRFLFFSRYSDDIYPDEDEFTRPSGDFSLD
jgi:hypothetical protein